MDPFQRRHRILCPEVEPVIGAVRHRLDDLLNERIPEAFEEAWLLFRVLYRLEAHSPGRPRYPEASWEAVEGYLGQS